MHHGVIFAAVMLIHCKY